MSIPLPVRLLPALELVLFGCTQPAQTGTTTLSPVATTARSAQGTNASSSQRPKPTATASTATLATTSESSSAAPQPSANPIPLRRSSSVHDERNMWKADAKSRQSIPAEKWPAAAAVPEAELSGLDSCYRTGPIGVPLSEGLLCIRAELTLHVGSLVFFAHVYVVQGGHMLEILHKPIGAGPMSPAERCTQPCDVKLDLQVEEEGRRLILLDAPERQCFSGLKELTESGYEGVRMFEQLHRYVCDARGTYMWQSNRYVKETQARSR